MPKSKVWTDLSPKKLKCGQCVYKTKNRSDLRRHERRHNDVKFPCDICNMPFMTFGHLGGHKLTVHGISKMPQKDRPEFRRFCSQCDYATWYSSDMAKHRRKHVTNKFPCPVCNYPLGNTTTLNVHMKKYHGNQYIVQKNHNNKHHSAKTYISSKQNDHGETTTVRRNKSQGTTNKSDKYNGRSCLEFKARSEIFATSRNHSDGFAHRGDYDGQLERGLFCPKERHSNREAIDRHLEDKPGRRKRDDISWESKTLSISKKKYSANPTRTRDGNTHITHRKIVERQLSQHHRSASAPQLLSCKHCRFRTTDKEAFRRHCERHTKGKFKCQYCAMPFLFSTNLDRHLKRKHTNSDESSDSSIDTASMNSPKLLKCISCRFVTYSYNQLNNHVKLHDNEDGEESKPLNRGSDVDSNSEFDFDDECPDVGFSLEDEDPTDTFRDNEGDTGDRSLSEEGPVVPPSAERVDEEDKLASSSELNLDYEDPDLQISLEGNADTAVERCPAVEGQQSHVGIEEYYCTQCNYETSDKKFIKLHVTMHGFPYGTPGNNSNRKASKMTNLRGYETRTVKQILPFQEIDPFGNDKSIKSLTKTFTATMNEINDEKDIAVKSAESEAISQDEDHGVALQFENSKQIDLSKAQSICETNYDTDLADASEFQSGSSVTSTSSTKSKVRNKVGRMTRQEFMESKKFYKIELKNGAHEYECRICMTDNIFTSIMDLCCHFDEVHEDIRRQICTTCKYCSRPFPKTDWQ